MKQEKKEREKTNFQESWLAAELYRRKQVFHTTEDLRVGKKKKKKKKKRFAST